MTEVIVPSGKTSSNPTTVSTVGPYWFVFHENPAATISHAPSRITQRPRTAPEREAADADARYAPADDHNGMRRERGVDVVPNQARTHGRGVRRGVVLDLVEAAHRNLHARRGRETEIHRVSAALDLRAAPWVSASPMTGVI